MEILNLDYNIGRLVLKALNINTTEIDAAFCLGIGDRTLYSYIKTYQIERKVVDNELKYISNSPKLKPETYLKQK